MQVTTPPVTSKSSQTTGRGDGGEEGGSKGSLLMMGFPSRMVEQWRSLCACHSRPTRGGYLCSRCGSKVCALPSSCPACGLTLILSTHLARSYHHLFPLRNWSEVSWKQVAAASQLHPGDEQNVCFGCGSRFPSLPPRDGWTDTAARRGGREAGVSESGRYACGVCGRHFCVDCDVFAHEIVHNCPGCQSREGVLGGVMQAGDGGEEVGMALHADDMDVG